MKFSCWLEGRLILEGRRKRGSKPVQMPKPESNKIEPTREIKQRIAGGRRDTTFGARSRPRGAVNKEEIESQE